MSCLSSKPLFLFVLSLALLSACSEKVEQKEVIRGVKVIKVVNASQDQVFTLSGEVKPRIEAGLGFRVAGKIVARLVEVGQKVAPGQVLARLDPTDLQLSQNSGKAQLDAAQTDYQLAQADYKRYQELRDKGFISSAELERRKATLDAAKAKTDQAHAQLSVLGNQAQYSVLKADAAGVVTSLSAEVGQVVNVGQPVVNVARTAEKEVLVSVPEDQLEFVRHANPIKIGIWALPNVEITGKLREVAAAADPSTRTYASRITLINPPEALQLGMTATIRLSLPDVASGSVLLPTTAIFSEQGKDAVWVVDANQTVNLKPVMMSGVQDNQVFVRGDLPPGTQVVTAGVHLLRVGQKVRVMDDVQAVSATDSQAAASAEKTIKP